MFSDTELLTWSACTIFYDDSVSSSHLNMIHAKLSQNAVVAMMTVTNKDDIGRLLPQAPFSSSSNRFLVITRKHLTEQFIIAVSLTNL